MKLNISLRHCAIAFVASALMAFTLTTAIATGQPANGTHEQCTGTETSCMDKNWVFLMTKEVWCCCFAGDNTWYKCLRTINVYVDIHDNSIHCYRLVSSSNTSETCIPASGRPGSAQKCETCGG